MSGDFIDRKIAVQGVRELFSMGDCYCDELSIVGMLNGLPSQPKWTPVTEALPKPWQEVLTTYEYNGKRFVQTAEYAGQDDENGYPLFCAFSDEFAPDHYNFVYVAWMPLPKPYKGE